MKQRIVSLKGKYIDQSLTRLSKRENPLNNIRAEKRNIITDSIEIQRILKECFQIFTDKIGTLEKIDKFLDTYDLLKLNKVGVKKTK